MPIKKGKYNLKVINPTWFKKGNISPMKDKKWTEESRKNIMGFGNHRFNKVPWNKGKKLSYMPIKAFKKGDKIRLGKKHSEESKLKMSRAMKGRLAWNKGIVYEAIKGNKHHMWKGGISYEPYSVDWTKTLKRSIRERDKYTCQLCFKEGNVVHHIDYNKKNCNPNNLITLCIPCHLKTNHNRTFWEKKFNENR